ncbi:MAG: HAD family hydrolase [Vicinamibacterales bacterium]
MIRLLAVDIDGTLLNSQGRVPDAHRDALAEVVRRGVQVALVTGRSFHFTSQVSTALPFPLTSIVNNGAVVKDAAGATIVRYVLPRDTALDILERTTAYEDCVGLVFDRPPGPDEHRQIVCDRMDWGHPDRSGYYARNRTFITTVSPLRLALTDDPIQVMFNGSVERMRGLARHLRSFPSTARFSVAVTEYEHRDFSLVDINGAGCSKGATLGRWCQRLGIAPAEVMAVGDNLNDLEMLQFAGTPVIMGNAVPALAGRGFHQTESHDADGLAHAIRRFVLEPDIS